MDLLGKPKIEDCKRDHADLRDKLDAFVAVVEAGQWRSPVDLQNALGRPDKVGPYYVFEVGGKKGARVSMVIQFIKQTVLINEVFTDHEEYMKWSNRVIQETAKIRKRGRQKKKS